MQYAVCSVHYSVFSSFLGAGICTGWKVFDGERTAALEAAYVDRESAATMSFQYRTSTYIVDFRVMEQSKQTTNTRRDIRCTMDACARAYEPVVLFQFIFRAVPLVESNARRREVWVAMDDQPEPAAAEENGVVDWGLVDSENGWRLWQILLSLNVGLGGGLETLFSVFDIDGNGSISRAELQAVRK